ncbi:hypothetical protein AARAC_001371 [Aspergillus arachidicola]|uniref:MFS transporter n=1 Tax=Aspergillus arachidicola TaxID=656916 RepID=A0A2G7G6A0_9EURO|nr:hypothetical protein AARAC_001371 [Aspergillus arachidicola]
MPDSTSTQQDEEKAIEPPVVSESPALDSALPPEGGVRGWLCCAGDVALAHWYLPNHLSRDSLEGLQLFGHLMDLYNPARSHMGSRFPIRPHCDAYGPRPVMPPCTFLRFFSLCMTSLSTEYYQIILAQGIGYGLGAGGIFTTSLVYVSQWFVKQRGLALGTTVAGSSSIGDVVFPFFLRLVMEDVDFNGMVRYTALFIGIALVGAFFLLSARLPPKKRDPETTWIDFKLFKNRGFAFYALGSYFVMWGLWAHFDYHSSNAGLIVFAVVYGFFSGAFVSIMMPCCAKSGSLETLGRQIGTYQGVIAISTLTGLPIMGAILGRQHNSTFKVLQVFAIATMFIGFVLLLISRNVLAAAHGTWKY